MGGYSKDISLLNKNHEKLEVYNKIKYNFNAKINKVDTEV